MKKYFVFMITVIAVFLLSFTAFAGEEEKCGDNLTWSYDSATQTFTVSGTGEMYDYGYDEDDEEREYTPWYWDYSDDAVNKKGTVKRVVVSEGVTSLGNNSFSGFGEAESVVLPESLISIGDYAFAECFALETVYIPKNVKSIGEGVFSSCKLTSISVAEDNPYYSTDGIALFNKDKTEIILFICSGQGESYSIPDTVKIIGDWAFSGAQIKSVVIPDGVSFIGAGAFSGSAVTSIHIPESVTHMENGAVRGHYALTEITVDENNPAYSSDEYGALYNKDKSEILSFPQGSSLTVYPLPSTVRAIGEFAFFMCNLQGILIPEGVTEIKEGAFCSASALTSVILPSSLTKIGVNAFSGSGITSVRIPGGVEKIEYEAFSGCASLKEVVITEGVRIIGERAFISSMSVHDMYLPSTITAVEENAFLGCYAAVHFDGTEDMAKEIDFASGNEEAEEMIGGVTLGEKISRELKKAFYEVIGFFDDIISHIRNFFEELFS